jgi:hypothetical protein
MSGDTHQAEMSAPPPVVHRLLAVGRVRPTRDARPATPVQRICAVRDGSSKYLSILDTIIIHFL